MAAQYTNDGASSSMFQGGLNASNLDRGLARPLDCRRWKRAGLPRRLNSGEIMDLELYDKRLLTRNTRNGKLTRKDVDTMLSGLEDMADNVEEVPVDEQLLLGSTRDESRIKAADVSDEDAAAID